MTSTETELWGWEEDLCSRLRARATAIAEEKRGERAAAAELSGGVAEAEASAASQRARARTAAEEADRVEEEVLELKEALASAKEEETALSAALSSLSEEREAALETGQALERGSGGLAEDLFGVRLHRKEGGGVGDWCVEVAGSAGWESGRRFRVNALEGGGFVVQSSEGDIRARATSLLECLFLARAHTHSLI